MLIKFDKIKIMKKDLLNLIISWIIVLVFALTVKVSYKEDYQDVFIFLSFFVVLIPLIFSNTWIRGMLSATASLLGIILITFLFWYTKNLYNNDFAFENYVPYVEMMISSLKGIILGVFLKLIYLIYKK